ncbi:MAG: hypothetical protein PEGG_01253 [Paraeggerthella hongkongensis]
MKPAKREEFIVQVIFKPNCGLENTRASLVMRRIVPLCETASCHPRAVKSDRSTIAYLRDHGLFIRFTSSVPEQVLLTIKGSFFVDRCTIVADKSVIPAYKKESIASGDLGGSASALPYSFADESHLSGRGSQLVNVLAQFEEVHRKLRERAESMPQDHELNSIVLSHTKVVDELRTAVARSRIERFDRIAPSLRALVADCSRRFGVLVDLDIADGHMVLDRSVLASMEEIIKRLVRLCLRDGIEQPEHRVAAGKPARALLRLRLEDDGSDVVCRIEHDGIPFNSHNVGQHAAKHGLLTRPLEAYTEEELGALLLVPGFAAASKTPVASMFSQFNEVASLLQHVGGRGEVRNTDHGTLEIVLHVPVPFTIMEAALLRTGSMTFALPAQRIDRFEAYRAERVELDDQGAQESQVAESQQVCDAFYVGEDGNRSNLINGAGSGSPLKAEDPRLVLFLEELGERRCLVVDAVVGYEQISVSRLPQLLDRGSLRKAGCFGYALLKNGDPCAVVSIRHLLNAAFKEEGSHA